MKNAVEKLLSEKGVKATPEELEALTHQWDSIQRLKGDLKSTLNDYDMGLIHHLKEDYK